MGTGRTGSTVAALAAVLICSAVRFAQAEDLLSLVFPEQRSIQVRDPAQLPGVVISGEQPPPTVAKPLTDLPPLMLSLDDVLRTALTNSEVIRVLAGVTAVSSGRTIYDVAVSNSAIDQQRARFDPRFQVQNGFHRTETPSAGFDPLDPTRATLGGLRTDGYRMDLGLSKTTVSGGTMSMGVTTNPTQFNPGVFPLNPQNRSAFELSYTQPLLQGGGWQANLAPLVVARIDTERSFFQFKDSVQELVRGVVAAYWDLVSARTDVWARTRQVEQLQQAYERAEALLSVGMASRAVVAQSQVALTNFRASLIAAKAGRLQREAALRNLVGLPPMDGYEIVPTTAPREDRSQWDWPELLNLAAERRPDIIELKLVLEADEQLLLQSRNQALPRADAVALYRWNGLEGEMPVGTNLSSAPGQFTDWTLAVNFSVPLGLRQERAQLRQRELLMARDRANLQQGLHAASHVLATSVRNLELSYEQYLAYKETRVAARSNLEQQLEEYKSGRVIFLNVLLAITDWGNAVSAEARSLLQYNTELANLEMQTGTILETHGIRFYEERFASLGPLSCLHKMACYPMALPPTSSVDRYSGGELPAENAFDLKDPMVRRETVPPSPSDRPPREELPPPNSLRP